MQVCVSYKVDWSKRTRHKTFQLLSLYWKSSLNPHNSEQFVEIYLYLIFQTPRNISYVRESSTYAEKYNDNFVNPILRQTHQELTPKESASPLPPPP